MSEHRRPRAATPEAKPSSETKPTADYLGHLVDKRRREGFVEATAPSPKRQRADDALVEVLREREQAGMSPPNAPPHAELHSVDCAHDPRRRG